jgi:transcriptional regulator with XRE-family HTH domain
MKETVKAICKKKGWNLKDLAENMGIARESLTRALSGNPTLSTITSIAKALDVPVYQLFPTGDAVSGYVEVKGSIHRISNREDILHVLRLIDNEL